jgi:hypothetical protein
MARVENVTFQDAGVLHCVKMVKVKVGTNVKEALNTSLYYEFCTVKKNDVDSSETSVSIQKLHVEFYVLLTVNLDISFKP